MTPNRSATVLLYSSRVSRRSGCAGFFPTGAVQAVSVFVGLLGAATAGAGVTPGPVFSTSGEALGVFVLAGAVLVGTALPVGRVAGCVLGAGAGIAGVASFGNCPVQPQRPRTIPTVGANPRLRLTKPGIWGVCGGSGSEDRRGMVWVGCRFGQPLQKNSRCRCIPFASPCVPSRRGRNPIPATLSGPFFRTPS